MKKLLTLLLLVTFSAAFFAQTEVVFSIKHKENIPADQMLMKLELSVMGNKTDSINTLLHKSLQKTLVRLKEFGLSEKQIFTFESQISSSYHDQYKYEAKQVYKILLTDFKLFDTIKADMLKTGVTGVSAVAFGSSKLKEHTQEAYKKAKAKAKQRVELLTDGKKYKLKEIIDNTSSPYYSRLDDELASQPGGETGINYCSPLEAEVKSTTITEVLVPVSVSLRFIYVLE